MRTTYLSLLERARDPEDGYARQLIHDLCRPLIRHYLRRDAALGAEVEDLMRDVLTDVARNLATFERARHGPFSAWLRAVTHARLVHHHRGRRPQPSPTASEGLRAALADQHSPVSQEWDRAHEHHALRRLLEVIEPDFDARTWTAFTMVIHDEVPVAETARRLTMSDCAVLVAKARVLKRLRDETTGLIG